MASKPDNRRYRFFFVITTDIGRIVMQDDLDRGSISMAVHRETPKIRAWIEAALISPGMKRGWTYHTAKFVIVCTA